MSDQPDKILAGQLKYTKHVCDLKWKEEKNTVKPIWTYRTMFSCILDQWKQQVILPVKLVSIKLHGALKHKEKTRPLTIFSWVVKPLYSVKYWWLRLMMPMKDVRSAVKRHGLSHLMPLRAVIRGPGIWPSLSLPPGILDNCFLKCNLQVAPSSESILRQLVSPNSLSFLVTQKLRCRRTKQTFECMTTLQRQRCVFHYNAEIYF